MCMVWAAANNLSWLISKGPPETLWGPFAFCGWFSRSGIVCQSASFASPRKPGISRKRSLGLCVLDGATSWRRHDRLDLMQVNAMAPRTRNICLANAATQGSPPVPHPVRAFPGGAGGYYLIIARSARRRVAPRNAIPTLNEMSQPIAVLQMQFLMQVNVLSRYSRDTHLNN